MNKIWLCIVLMGCLMKAHGAVDIQRYCQSNVAANTERAAWGFELRAQMLDQCEGQNLRICSKPYQDKITVQERADTFALKEMLKRQPVSNLKQYLMQKASLQKTTAAYMALRGVGNDAEAVAQLIYADCISSMPVDLAAIESEGGSTSMVVPACPNFAGSDPVYLKRCCTPDCYCDVYCQ